jgi:hypothetical protein
MKLEVWKPILLEKERFDKIRDLIKLWICLINEIISVIEKIYKFEDSIKLCFGLINDVRSLIEELISSGT